MRIVDRIFNNSSINVSFDEFANEYYEYHKSNSTNYFAAALSSLKERVVMPTFWHGTELSFANELINNFERIIKATPREIPDIITHFSTGHYKYLICSAQGERTDFGKQLEKIFNYQTFRSRWKASWFCERIQIKACLYCNAQFALAVGKEGAQKKLLFQLDHFYSKSIYPYLSLTMGNLVPSCSTCNNSKSDSGFTISSHIHPYFEDTNLMFTFTLDDDNLRQYLLGDINHNLLKPKLDIHNSKFELHAKAFNLEDIYNKHTDVIEEMIMKKKYYSQSRIEELRTEFSELALSNSTIDRFILGNYSLDSEINYRPLAKLSRDIAKHLGLLISDSDS